LRSARQQCAAAITGAADGGRAGQISSAIVADVMWWLHRWLRAYLMMKESRYRDVLSNSLLDSFGEGTEGGL